MITPRIILRALAFGAIAETLALAVSFGLYSLKQGREPMEPPFNLIATVLQMPGNIISNWLGERVNCSTWWVLTSTFFVQAVLWAAIGCGYQVWRVRKRP
jgi:hypothetical protein